VRHRRAVGIASSVNRIERPYVLPTMFNEAYVRAVVAERVRARDRNLHARSTLPANEMLHVDNAALAVRPIEIADADRLAHLFGRLSRESVRSRFFSPVRRMPRSMLLRLADVDHCRREALAALDGDEIVAVARYDEMRNPALPGARDAEIAITVDDAWQHRGIGLRLARRLCVVARDRGYDAFVARILPENRAALGLVRELAPDATVRFAGGDYEARFPLST
jgi:RimJ/RimL family protein N-acetyltransferase